MSSVASRHPLAAIVVVLFGLAAALPTAAQDRLEAAYGADPLQRLDIFPQPGLKGAPVLIYVHGGSWRTGDKKAVASLPDYARRNGFLLLSVNYRLSPRVDAGGEAEDVASAVAWARANAARLGGAADRIVLMGHSAGAHLAALVGVDPTYLAAHGMKPADLAGVVPIDTAAYDAVAQLAFIRKTSPRGDGGLYEAPFGARPAALSPTRLARAGRRYPPFLIFHIVDRRDSPVQSAGFGKALVAAGARATVVAAPGETHGSINRGFGEPGDAEGERAAAFINLVRASPGR